MARPRGVSKTRLNLEMSQKTRDRIESLRDKTDADSMAEVVRRAIEVYDLLVDGRDAGSTLILRAGGVDREIVLV